MKTFVIQMEVQAERASNIDQKAIEASCNGEITGIGQKPEKREMNPEVLAKLRAMGGRPPQS